MWLMALWAAAGRVSAGDDTLALGVHRGAVGVESDELLASLEAPFVLPAGRRGDVMGVADCRRGDGDAGDSGRRNGELRGEP